jgi:hypothetical protein
MNTEESWIDNDMTATLNAEYRSRAKTPVFADVGSCRIVVPLAYKGNADKFLDDLFHNEKHAAAYDKHNKKHPNEPIEMNTFKIGDAYVVQDIRLVKHNIPPQLMRTMAVVKAKQNYRNAIKTAQDLRKFFPDKKFPVTLNRQELKHYRDLLLQKRAEEFANLVAEKVRYGANWSVEKCQQAIGKINPALLKATAYLNKTNHHSVRGKFNKATISRLKHGAAIAAVGMFMAGSLSVCEHKTSDKQSVTTEQTADMNKISIKDESDLLKAFDQTYYQILQTFTIDEVMRLKAYSDNGKNLNTIGIGSYYMPANNNPYSKDWITTTKYLNKYPDVKNNGITADYVIKLPIGWCFTRDGGRIAKNMRKALDGCSVKPNEFVAMFSCWYNNESCGMTACNAFKNNPNNTNAYVREFLNTLPKNKQFDLGLMKRRIFEACIMLNVEGMYDKLGELKVKDGVNSAGKLYTLTAAYAGLSEEMVKQVYEQLKGPKKNVREILKPAAKAILDWKQKDDACKTVQQVLDGHNIQSENCFRSALQEKTSQQQKLWNLAIKAMEKDDNNNALNLLNQLQISGYHKADMYLCKAQACYNSGDYQECRQACRAALKDKAHPELYSEVYNLAANACDKLGDPESAQQNRRLAEKKKVTSSQSKTYEATTLDFLMVKAKAQGR